MRNSNKRGNNAETKKIPQSNSEIYTESLKQLSKDKLVKFLMTEMNLKNEAYHFIIENNLSGKFHKKKPAKKIKVNIRYKHLTDINRNNLQDALYEIEPHLESHEKWFLDKLPDVLYDYNINRPATAKRFRSHAEFYLRVKDLLLPVVDKCNSVVSSETLSSLITMIDLNTNINNN